MAGIPRRRQHRPFTVLNRTLPMPAVVVDADGIIRWIDVHPDYSARSEPEDILAAVTAAAGGWMRHE